MRILPLGFRDGELREQFGGAVGDDGLDGDTEDADGFGQDVQHGGHAGGVGFFEGPGGLGVHILVAGVDELPDGFQGAVELEFIGGFADLRQQGFVGVVQQGLVVGGEGAGGRDFCIAVFGDHAERALGEVAEAVGKIAVDFGHRVVVAEIAVIAVRDFAHQDVAGLVEAEGVHQVFRGDDIADGFGHFLAVHIDEAVGEDGFWQRQSGGHQEGRPVDAVEADDVLADDVEIGRPVFGKFAVRIRVADAGDVIGQRVQPDIHDVFFIARHRHAPVEGGAGDGEVLQPALHKRDDLVPAAFGLDEFGVFLVIAQQFFGIGGEAEEIARLHHPFDRRAGGGQFGAVRAGGKFAVREIGLVAHGIPAVIFAKENIVRAVGLNRFPDGLGGVVMARLRRADEIVVGGIEPARHILELGVDLVA